jgi:hypothetical protein
MTASRTLFLGALALVAGAAFVAARPAPAEDPPYELRYVSITGDGSTAKAWFEGAPPSGTKVQEALDRFTREGYRLGTFSPAWRQPQISVNTGTTVPGTSALQDSVYVLFLEKGRR